MRIRNWILKSLNILFKIRDKRKEIMKLDKTKRYGGFLQIVDLEKEKSRIELLIEIQIELKVLINNGKLDKR